MYCLGIHKKYMCIVYAVTSSTCVLFRHSQAVHVYCFGIHKQYMCIVYVVTSNTCVLFRYSQEVHVYCLCVLFT